MTEPPLPPHLDPRGRAAARRAARQRAALASGTLRVSDLDRRHSRGAGRGVRLTAMAVVGLLSLAVVFASGWAWYRYRQFNQDIVRLNVFADSGATPVKDIDGKDQNILIVGNDDRTGDTPAELAELSTNADGGSLATDTMLLLHVPANGKNAVAISFPRDSYVQIAGGNGMHKLNSAYGDGYTSVSGSAVQKRGAGGALLIQTIQALTGLKIDHFAQVNLYGFYTISNAIGGVPVNMCHAVGPATSYGQTGNYIDSGFEPDGTFVYSYSGIDLHAGVQSISGKQALAFVRQRHGLPGGDLDRIKRQQYFLSAAFRQITSRGVLLNPGKLDSLLTAVDGSLQLDSGFNLIDLANQVSGLSANNINFQTIPTEGDISTASDGDALQVDPGQVQAFVQKLIGQSAAAPVAPSAIRLAVLNGTDTNGLAAATATTLQQAGFTVTSTGSDTQSDAVTTVEYPAGQLAQATTVAAYVPGARTQQTSSVSTVTLVLGADGKRAVAALPRASAPAASASAPAAPVTPADSGCVN